MDSGIDGMDDHEMHKTQLEQWVDNTEAPEPMYKGKSIFEVDLDKDLQNQPWRKPDADISDYFNYGFTEQTWKMYADHIMRQKRADEASRGQPTDGPV